MEVNKEAQGTFTVVNEEGKETVCEVLFTFDSEETKKSYIVYTDNSTDSEGNTNVFASVYDPTVNAETLQPIETDREWAIIETILKEIQSTVAGDDEDDEDDEYDDEDDEDDEDVENFRTQLQEALKANDVRRLDQTADCICDYLVNERDLWNITELFKMLVEADKQLPWDVNFLMLGNNAYAKKNFAVAERAFRKASEEKKNLRACNNYAYMIRRGEVENPSRYTAVDAAELLKPGVEEKEPFSMINMALVWALNVGDADSWALADKIMSLLPDNDVNAVLYWWQQAAMDGDVEGELVHLWLLRHTKAEKSPLGSYAELLAHVSAKIKNLPEFFCR
jgi:uncharacterized protein YrzB (UPF0473 family)